MRFPIGGEELTEAAAMHLLSSPDGTVRKEAALSVGAVLGRNARVFALITNTLAKDKEIEDRWRKFPHPISARNLSNYVEDEVVGALVGAVRARYPTLSHRNSRLTAGWFGVEAHPYWDRNATRPEDDDRPIPWYEAERTVLSAYRAFSPEISGYRHEILRRRAGSTLRCARGSRPAPSPTRPCRAPTRICG